MADRDLLIIGAGISGLSMAHYAAAAGLNVLVLEREDRVGGCLHSHRFGGEMDGFWLELGAHSGFNSYGNLLAILEQVGLLGRLQRRARVGFRLLVGGAVKSIPSQLYFPALALAPVRMLGLIKTGRTVAEYYGHIVGRRNYAAVFEPAFDAVICQPAGEFPADSLFQPRPRRKDVPRGEMFAGEAREHRGDEPADAGSKEHPKGKPAAEGRADRLRSVVQLHPARVGKGGGVERVTRRFDGRPHRSVLSGRRRLRFAKERCGCSPGGPSRWLPFVAVTR